MENIKSLLDILNTLLVYYKSKSDAKISMFTEKNKKYKEYMNSYLHYYEKYNNIIHRDINLALVEFDNKDKIDNFSLVYEVFNNVIENEKVIHITVSIHVFFRLFKMKHYIEKQLTDIEDIIKYDEQDNIVWYRGQTNTNWQLVPSFFRSAKRTALWTWSDIYKDYKSKPSKVSLINKLNEVDIDTKSFPYKTAAFIQHSIGYSPLIDFSRSSKVALSFALSNASSMVNYYGDDACVYVLELNNYRILTELEDIDNAIRGSKVQVFRRNESIFNLITNQMWIDLLSGSITSVIHLINKPTNDRMMFQKGTFILYDNAIIIGDEIFMSYNKVSFIGRHLTKYNIDTKSKERLYEKLMIDYPQYHQRYLLDPYLYLGEPDK